MSAISIPQTRRAAPPPRPGFAPQRLARLVRDAVAECHLDLSGRCVVTEAATGAYVVTPVIAALAGARRVIAITRPTRYGTRSEVREATLELAARLGVDGRDRGGRGAERRAPRRGRRRHQLRPRATASTRGWCDSSRPAPWSR